MRSSVRLKQYDRLADDDFLPSYRPGMLAGLGLDVDCCFFEPEQPCQVRPDGRFVGAKLGLLGMDDDVAVDGAPAGSVHLFDHLRQQPGAIQIAPLGSVSG